MKLLAAFVSVALAFAGPTARADETVAAPAGEARNDPAKPDEAKPYTGEPDGTFVALADEKKKEEPIKLPTGFRPKKRGKFVVYCRKVTVLGSRFPAETCYDEAGIRAYLQEQEENAAKVDQYRRVCAIQGACGSH
jgi:hypothetical protein